MMCLKTDNNFGMYKTGALDYTPELLERLPAMSAAFFKIVRERERAFGLQSNWNRCNAKRRF